MPGGVLVIGVGGTGRGIVNQLKWRLEEHYGAAENAGVVLHVVDGPSADQMNEGPGGFQIDVARGSKEKYRFSSNPAPTLKTLEGGQRIINISDWLSQAEAEATPKEGIVPAAGFGGIRVPGRVTLFLEVDTIALTIKALLNDAKSHLENARKQALNDNRPVMDGQGPASLTVFLCGSQSGGTGAGLLTDVAHITRKLLSDDGRLIGIIVLPNAFSDFKEADERLRLIANGMAGLREVLRSQAGAPFVVKYNENLSVRNRQLFNLCYLVDGGQYAGHSPKQYLYAGVADMILAHIRDRKDIYPGLPNRITSVEHARPQNRFSRFGIHEFVYSARDVAEILSLKFVQEVLEKAYTKAPDDPFDGHHRAMELLRDVSAFTHMANQLGQNQAPPLAPEQNNYLQLGQSLEIRSQRSHYPGFPCPDLHKEVGKSSMIFGRKTNAVVQTTTKRYIEGYVGVPGSTEPRCIHGWTGRQESVLLDEFEKALVSEVDSFFFRRHEGQLVPLSWGEDHGSMAKAAEFVEEVKRKLTLLTQALNEAYNRYRTIVQTDGTEISISEKARAEMDAVLAGLNPNSIDRQKQEKYLELGNRYLRIYLWEIFIDVARRIAGRLLDLSARLLGKLALEADGWLLRLQTDAGRAQEEEIRWESIRSELSQMETRTYLPRGSGDEGGLYSEKVRAPYLDNYLRRCSWLIASEVDSDREKDTVDNFRVCARTPQAPGFSSPVSKRRLRTHHDKKYGEIELRNFSWRETAAYIKSQIKRDLENLSLWDLMALDFEQNFCYRADQKGRGFQEQLAAFVKEKCDLLVGGANNLQLSSSTAGSVGVKEYCLSAFVDVAEPELLKDIIATRISRELRERGVQPRLNPGLTHQLTLLKVDDGIDIDSWNYLAAGQKEYYSYLARKPALPPVSLFNNEKNAVQVEKQLAEEAYSANPTWLPPEIVALLGNLREIQAVTLCFAFGLLERNDHEWEDGTPPLPSLGIKGPDNEVFWIAPEWQWGKILEKLLYDEGLRPKLKLVLDAWKNYAETFQQNDRAAIEKILSEKMRELQIAEVPASYQNAFPDSIDQREKLLGVMRAMMKIYQKQVSVSSKSK